MLCEMMEGVVNKNQRQHRHRVKESINQIARDQGDVVRMQRRKIIIMKQAAIFVLLSLLVMVVPAWAQPPPDLLSQVVLKDSAGKPLTGTFSITLRLYNVATGGTPLWTETHSRVSVVNGRFSVVLGSVTPYSPAQFSEPDRWLGVSVGSDPEMKPRHRIPK